VSDRTALLKLADAAERDRADAAAEFGEAEPRYLERLVVDRARRHAERVLGHDAARLLRWDFDRDSPGIVACAEIDSETFVETRMDDEGHVTGFVLILACGSCNQENETEITCLADLAAPLRGELP